MSFHPGILALLLGSTLISAILCYCAYEGFRIIRYWNIRSGSELQLDLERRTYLISLAMSYALGFEILSLFLFIYTADSLSSLFIGAMCAAGSLNVNEFGYPALILKIVNFLLAGIWLIVNHIDNKASNYPLIRIKYGMLIAIAPFLIAEAVVQGAYLISLKPDILTSCCGTIFTADNATVISGLIRLPRTRVEVLFYGCTSVSILLGLLFYYKGKGGYCFSFSALITFLSGILALISFISLYIYELPTHHCPFCILHSEYDFVGYLMYITLLTGAVTGMGVGVIMPFKGYPSLSEVLPAFQKKLAMCSMLSITGFFLIAVIAILLSNLSLSAY